MRLINTTTFEFKEFFNPRDVEYVIVSHRWTDEEVSYEEYPLYLSSARTAGRGWTKIQKACEIAKAADVSWVWMDTCCIDKKSSAELTEAINSMYNFYASAYLCCVFLHDVHPSPLLEPESYCRREEFENSEWFTRGWTLQEVLAPKHICFFNSQFEWIGTEEKHAQLIAEITKIDPKCLADPLVIQHTTVGTRLTWASSRHTTRDEDIGYCLLGLLDVNMPLLYGEGGTKAFQRLQLELIRKTDDETVFAWGSADSHPDDSLSGPLTSSPADFRSPATVAMKKRYARGFRLPCSMTNKGLQLTLDFPTELKMGFRLKRRTQEKIFSSRLAAPVLLPLRCTRTIADGGLEALAIAFTAEVVSREERAMEGRRLYILASTLERAETQWTTPEHQWGMRDWGV